MSILAVLVCGFMLVPMLACGGDPSVSQTVGLAAAVVDEFGQPLSGTEPAAPRYGVPYVQGDLVQVLHAVDGIIYPPDVSGVPHSNNVLLATSRIGLGVSPQLAQPARFGDNVAPRPGGNSRIFVRVYNATSTGEASFYGDSQTFLVRSWKNEVFYANITSTDLPLDPNDDDGDGLNNSWEKSLGTDPNEADTDGDGLTDGEERLTGTDSLDPESVFVIVQVLPAGGDDALLRWQSQAGLSYRIEYTSTSLSQHPAFQLIATVPSAGDETEFLVPGGLADEQGSYRVRAVGE